MYEERASSVVGAVAWTTTHAGAGAVSILPDGCMDLLWFGDRLVVAGPDTRAQASTVDAGRSVHGLRFDPGTLPALLGIPAHALADQRVPLAELWAPNEVAALEDEVAGSADPLAALESLVGRRRRDAEAPSPLVRVVAGALAAGEPVATVADRVGLSPRQLQRRSLQAFGYGPKTLNRILRFQRALALARGGCSLVEAAARSGYADQAHLARDVRALTGTTAGRLVG